MPAEPVTILKTKLYMPPLRRDALARQRLVLRIGEGLWQPPQFTRKLTLLSAPAGFGKTTLICQWLAELQIPGLQAAWLTVDEDDNDPARFLRHVAAALQTCRPEIGREAAQTLQAAQSSLAAAPSLLLNDLAELSAPLILVLDDYHHIEAKAVHGLVSALIEGLPAQAHIVIATRADPPLPLARWRARGQLAELRLADLRLDLQETSSLLHTLLGDPLPEGAVNSLFERTEGWIAGLQMTALAMHTYADAQPAPGAQNAGHFLQDFTRSNRFILDYLIEEVLQRQPAVIQAFLLQTSILSRLCAPLCDAVLGDPGALEGLLPPNLAGRLPSASPSETILEYLERANLFLIPLDGERRWYRYHQLFADLLQKQLFASQADRLPELHRRASRWLEEAGLLHEAVEHALDGGDFERAAGMIEQRAEALLLQAELQTFLRWQEKLPEASLQARPALQVYRAWILAALGRPLQEIEALVSDLAGQQGVLPGYIDALNAMLASLRGRLALSAELARRALEQLPAGELLGRAMSARILGLGLLATGDISEGIHFLEETIQHSQQSGRIAIAVRSLILLADLYLRLSQLRQAQTCYERAIAVAAEKGLPRLPEVSEAYIGLGEALLEVNRLEPAEKSIRQGLQIAQKFQPMSAMRGCVSLARVRQAQNDPAGAEEAFAQAYRITEGFTVTHLDDLYVAMYQAGVWVEQGRLEDAAGWVNRRGLHVERAAALAQADEDTLETHYYKYEALVAARWLLYRGQADEAQRVIDAWLPRLEQTGRVSLAMEFKLLRALVLFSLGAAEEAAGLLTPLLELGQAQGYVRRFLDGGARMHELLRFYARKIQPAAPLAGYVQNLLAAFDPRGGQTAIRPPDALSEREREVLRLLCTSLAIDEIAGQLFIAESTLRSHIKRIYSKLGVHSRLEAIQQAKTLGLL